MASALDRIEERTLNRDYFEELTMDQIRNEAKRLNVPLLPDRDRLVDAFITHLERLSPPLETANECDAEGGASHEPELLGDTRRATKVTSRLRGV